MYWNVHTPLRITPLNGSCGVLIHRNMIDLRKSIYFINKRYYTAPYLSIPERQYKGTTVPLGCDYVIEYGPLPYMLSVIFPRIITMTQTPISTIPIDDIIEQSKGLLK